MADEKYPEDALWPARKALEIALRQESRLGAIETELRSVRDDVRRDIADHKEVVTGVEERATAADKFVRRVIRWASGLIIGSIGAAVMMIYSAGQNSASRKADAEMERSEVIHKIESLERSLTELRGQVRLLLQSRLEHQ